MKLLMIMYGKGIGGAELQFLELAQELSKRHQIRLVSLGGDGALKNDKLPKGIELQVFSYSGKIAAALALIKALLMNLPYRPHAIITTSFSANVLGYLISIFHSVKLVSLQTVSKAMRYPALDRLILKRFTKLIAGSTDIKKFLLQHGQSSERIEVINNWVDFTNRKVTADVASTREKFGIGTIDIVLGCIGRLHPQKGQEYLIRAFRILRERHPRLRLVLVGDGPNGDLFKREARDLGDAVIFTGSVVGSDYNNLLNAFDIYVQPSRFEGMPRTLLDAMFMEKPIVATAVNGNLDAIHDKKNGLLVPAENVDAIISATEDFLNKPEMAADLARQAHQDALTSFDMARQLQHIEQLL
ncbi:hypothetical protein AUK15_00500 [Candidatus Nomurabacteria bacterium CG2_30_43_9]|uniref:Glycosyl transferase family 1 domain-containing protein n=1 Tax=Candidatus Nomurabacteria bacterium CG2_30_43_9 TaxID=1805283 RepID=A0A1J5GCV6_9BACT|nr:MAG: hypothetical protein AUK15_00500 [Candidatus Nomurabacteria bacterium CG2_30_43_9]